MKKFLVALFLFSLFSPLSLLASNRRLGVEVLGVNNSRGERDWSNTIRAESGEVIEFKAEIHNRGSDTARNVVVWIEFTPGRPSPRPAVRLYARADNQEEASGVASVVVSMAQDLGLLSLRSGSAIGGMGSGRSINLGTQPVSVGDLPPGPNPIQVSFLTDLIVPITPTQDPTRTPRRHLTPNPTATPQQVLGIATEVTPTPTRYPTATIAPTPLPVKKGLPPKTPDTGFPAPVIGLAVTSLGGVGLLLRRLSRKVW